MKVYVIKYKETSIKTFTIYTAADSLDGATKLARQYKNDFNTFSSPDETMVHREIDSVEEI